MNCSPIWAAATTFARRCSSSAGAMYRADGLVALRPVGETEFVNWRRGDERQRPLWPEARACAGIVGHVDLRSGDSVVETRARSPHPRWRRAVSRHSPQRPRSTPTPMCLAASACTPTGLYMDDGFRLRAGFSALGAAGPFLRRLASRGRSCPELIDLVRAVSGTTKVVLDHVGTPLGIGAYAGKREERFPIWAENIRARAKSENVFCKLGGSPCPSRALHRFLSEPGGFVSVSLPPNGSPISRPASRRSAQSAACSRATSRWTSGLVQLSDAVERLQGVRRRLFGGREGPPLLRRRQPVLSALALDSGAPGLS